MGSINTGNAPYESRMVELVGLPDFELDNGEWLFYNNMLYSIFVSDLDQNRQNIWWNLTNPEPFVSMQNRRSGKSHMMCTTITRILANIRDVQINVLEFVQKSAPRTEFANLLDSTLNSAPFVHLGCTHGQQRIGVVKEEFTSELMYTTCSEKDCVLSYYESICAQATGTMGSDSFCSRLVIWYRNNTFRFGGDMEWLRNLMSGEHPWEFIKIILMVHYPKPNRNVSKSANNQVGSPDEVAKPDQL